MPHTKEQKKIYNASPKGKKSSKICRWREQGIIDSDFDDLYNYVLGETNCMICDKKYKNSQDRQVDHDHDDGTVRYICCRKCNTTILSEKTRTDNTSGHTGISYDKRSDRHVVEWRVDGVRNYRCFKSKDDAIEFNKNKR